MMTSRWLRFSTSGILVVCHFERLEVLGRGLVDSGVLLVVLGMVGCCVVYFQFPKIFKRLVSAPTKSYSKIDVTVRRGLKRRIINRCYYKDLKTRGPHLDHLKVFLEIAYKPPRYMQAVDVRIP